MGRVDAQVKSRGFCRRCVPDSENRTRASLVAEPLLK
jgi:hypothetical protein